jgi:hypothetical protein
MEAAVECTHCRVVMTSWSAPGSPIRYWQCPFCSRTHSSLYGEVFRRRAGARLLEGPAQAGERTAPSPASIPMASAEEIRWARVKTSAARWFARLEAEERPAPTPAPIKLRVRAALEAARDEDLPELDPDDVVEIVELEPVAAAPARARAKR